MTQKHENAERRDRILDTACELFLHFGFDKTTVSDIARQAGVSKGAIYLHFDSKESLLEALILREMKAYSEKWLVLLEQDPKGGTLAGMYKNSLYALSESKFMAAMFKQDSRILGNYLHKPDNFFQAYQDGQAQPERLVFVKFMQAKGAMRKDVNPQVIAHIMDMLAYSMVGMEGMKPKEHFPPIDDLIEGIADLMERALTPEDGGNPEAGREIIRQLAEAGRQQYNEITTQNEE